MKYLKGKNNNFIITFDFLKKFEKLVPFSTKGRILNV